MAGVVVLALARSWFNPLVAALTSSTVRGPARAGQRYWGTVEIVGLAYIALTPLENYSFGSGSPLRIAGLTFLVVWFVSLMRTRRALRVSWLAALPFFMLTVWVACTALWSWNQSAAPSAIQVTLALTLSAIAIADTFKDRLIYPIRALAFGGALSAVWLLLAGTTLESVNVEVGQVGVGGIDQNIFAFGLSVSLAALAYLIDHDSVRVRLPAIAGFLLIAVALLRAGSRTGLVSLLLVSLVAVLVTARSPRALLWPALAGLGAVLIFIFLRDAGLIASRLLDFAENPVYSDSRDEIIALYRLSQDYWQVKGVGAGADMFYLGAQAGDYRNAHSAFWATWIELGAVGLMIWVFILARVLMCAARLREWQFFVLAAGPILAFAYSLGPMRSNMMWAVFGMALTGYLTASQRAALRQGMTGYGGRSCLPSTSARAGTRPSGRVAKATHRRPRSNSA